MDNPKSAENVKEKVLKVIMDNNQGAEDVREFLLKVLTGDNELGYSVKHALRNLGLIRKRADAPNRVGMDAWYQDHISDYELTAKGLARLQGEQDGI